jgi:hypothetical protein
MAKSMDAMGWMEFMTRRALLLFIPVVCASTLVPGDAPLTVEFSRGYNEWTRERQKELNNPGTYNWQARKCWTKVRNLWKDLDIFERNI